MSYDFKDHCEDRKIEHFYDMKDHRLLKRCLSRQQTSQQARVQGEKCLSVTPWAFSCSFSFWLSCVLSPDSTPGRNKIHQGSFYFLFFIFFLNELALELIHHLKKYQLMFGSIGFDRRKIRKYKEKKLKKHGVLPAGESNPGLPRDRRGYSPLYYRGLHSGVEIF